MACKNGRVQGKGNAGRFVDREPRICAAGLSSAPPGDTVAACLQHYVLQDQVDALFSDVIMPLKKPHTLPFQRKPPPLDMRHAFYGEVAQLINPPMQTKFEKLTEDFKETVYSSYWKKAVSKIKDPVPMLPGGLDVYGTTFGIKSTSNEPAYDLIFPSDKVIGQGDPPPAMLKDRKYCETFNPDLIYGYRSNIDKRGKLMKCCLTDDNVVQGKTSKKVTVTKHSVFQKRNQPLVGQCLAPNNNIQEVPEGHAFGDEGFSENEEYMTHCKVNPQYNFFKECMAHLNSLRICMSKRYLPIFYRRFYSELKYLDKQRCGWLPKQVVYDECGARLIRFKPTYLEPLLILCNCFDGSNIEYKVFLNLINFKEPLIIDMPKIDKIPPECLDYSTTYREMVKTGQETDTRGSAGMPSARYFDMEYPAVPPGSCKADKDALGDESDVRACVNPSIMTTISVSHRDMFAVRDENTVRRLFESIGDKLTDEKFNDVWKEAQKHHSKGLVCFETFRRALEKLGTE